MTAEAIDWHPIEQGPPDADTTVMVSLDDSHDEPTWLGFYDGATWRDVGGMPIKGVTDWADMPAGTRRPRMTTT